MCFMCHGQNKGESHCTMLVCAFVNCEEMTLERQKERSQCFACIAKERGLCSRVKGFTEGEVGHARVPAMCWNEESGCSVGLG